MPASATGNTAGGRSLPVYPPAAWQQAVFKAPLLLWRLGFGPLLRDRLLVITHTGRRSGLPRRTVVEYHQLGERKYVVCAFGRRAQWYGNILADPLVTIQAADGPEAAVARRVTDDEELLAVYALMQQRNPLMLGWYLDSAGVANTAQGVLRGKDRLDILTFEPADRPAPPPLPADLTWVWAVMAAGAGLLWRRRRRS